MRFGRGIADCRAEIDEVLSPSILRPPRPECVAEKVELLVRVVTPSVVILAIDDLRLLRMQLQPAFSKPPLQHRLQPLRLRFAHAVAEDIISKALERDARMVFHHPPVERIVQEEIRQQG